MTKTPTLYYSPGACSMSAHLFLLEVGADFVAHPVVIANGDHRKPEFLAINPRGRVPALAVDGTIIVENIAILNLLAARHADAGLLPAPGTVDHARCLSRMSWIATSLHIAFAQIWRGERFVSDSADFPQVAARGRALVAEYFGELDAHFAATGGWYLGEAYSLVDINLLPFYRFGNRIGLDMAGDYPAFTAWQDRMLVRPAVQKVLATEGVAMTDRIPA